MTFCRLTLAALALSAAACGAPLQNTSGPSALAERPPPSLLAGSARSSALGVNSCPDGTAPTVLPTGTHDNSATLTWLAVDGIRDYAWAIDRMSAANKLEPVKAFVVNDGVLTVTVTLGSGTYYGYIRTRNSCGGYGPRSAAVVFTVDTGEPVPVLRGDGNGGGAPAAGTPGGGAPSYEAPAEDAPAYTPPTQQPGNGGGKDKGGDCPNGAGGDHNGDGHRDCGLGNGK